MNQFKAKLLLSAVALVLSAGVGLSPTSVHAAEFSELRPLIELNATDGDAGLQIMIDADRWQRVTVHAPNGELIYEVVGSGSVQQQGMTENFFESAEPDCQELPLADVLKRFPAGEYVFTGETIDGDKLEDEATLTHALPGAPQNLSPNKIGGVDPANTVITWAAGVDLGECPPIGVDIADPGDVELFAYQVIVQREEPEPALDFIIEVPPETTRVEMPGVFMTEDSIYKFEIIAIEARDDEKGNQTVVEGFFCTAPISTDDCELPD